MNLKISLDDFDLKFSQLAQITSAQATVTDNNTREIEKVTFTKQGDNLVASVPTVGAKSAFNYDVLLLVVIFGASMFLTQKIMMAANKMQQADPAQESNAKNTRHNDACNVDCNIPVYSYSGRQCCYI